MTTTGWTESCPKCDSTDFEMEERYGDKRGECPSCGYFFERGAVFCSEGFLSRTRSNGSSPGLVNTWFQLPSAFNADVHVEYTHLGTMTHPGKLLPEGPIHRAAKSGDLEGLEAALAAIPESLRLLDPVWGMSLLHAAALGNRPSVAGWLLTKDEGPNARDSTGDTPLHSASAVGARQVAQMLIAAGSDVAAANDDGETPLHVAAAAGRGDVAQLLLDSGADIEARDTRGRTALLSALDMHWDTAWAVVDVLLSRGASARAADHDGRNPLHLVGPLQGNIVSDLIKHGADVDGRDSKGRTPLHCACDGRSVDRLARALLSQGASVNARDLEGRTPLHLALAVAPSGLTRPLEEDRRVRSLFDLLTSNGADASATDNAGVTPVTVAVKSGFLGCARELLRGGASPGGLTPEYARSSDGTGLLHAAVDSRRLDVVEALLEQGIDVDGNGPDGNTALHLAARAGSVEIIRVLLAAGANSNSLNSRGQAPLHLVARPAHDWPEGDEPDDDPSTVDAVALLVAAGADVNAADSRGRTPLHDAAEVLHVSAVRVLLEHGAAVNAQDVEGDTPLHRAASKAMWLGGEKRRALSMLVAAGGRLDALNSAGKAPIQLALGRFERGGRARMDSHSEEDLCSRPYLDPDTPVAEAHLSVRAVNALKRLGCATLRAVSLCSLDDLVSSRNLGKKDLAAIRERLAAAGLSLRGS